MTRLTLALATLLFTFYSLSASKTKYKLGKVTAEELSSSHCPIDEEADSYYLFDIGKSSIDFDNSTSGKWVIKFERKFKIKVLNKEGQYAANFIIPLHDYGPNSRDELTNIKGRTYNLISGKVESVKLSSDNIKEVEVNKYLKHIKYAMPQVRSGSIIEIEYTITSDFVSLYYPWSFQHDIPVIHSEYDITIPDFLEYSTQVSGHTHFSRQELDNYNQSFVIKYDDNSGPGLPTHESFTLNSYSKHSLFTADSIQAFQPEPYISSVRDNITRVSFQLTSVQHKNSFKHNIADTWENIDYRLLNDEDFGGFLKKEKSFTEILGSLNAESPIADERLLEIYFQLKSRVQWNQYYSVYTDESASQVWKIGSANSAELNLMLCGVLNAAGISAKPVVSCTRNWGYFNRYTPSLAQINHVLVLASLGDKSILLDLTSNAPPGLIPTNSINFYGRIPGEALEESWVRLSPTQEHKTHSLINITIDPASNKVHGNYRAVLKDYAALDARNSFSSNSYKMEMQKMWNSKYPGLQIDSLVVEGFEHSINDIKTNFEFTSESSIENVGDTYLVNLKLSNQIGENPFAGGERKYPIDLAYGRDIKSNMTINIPEGFKIENLPEAQKIALPDNKGSFQYSIIQHGNLIQINSAFLLNERIFSPTDFDYLKQFYGLVIDKLNEPIVLSKL